MPARKIVLHTPLDRALLPGFLERCLADGVILIAVVGPGAREIEGEIDWILVDDYLESDDWTPERHIVTSAPPDETMEEIRCFVALWDNGGQKDDPVAEVRL